MPNSYYNKDPLEMFQMTGVPTPQPVPMQQDPSLMDVASPLLASKAADVAAEKGLPMAASLGKDAYAGLMGAFTPSAAATGAMKAGVDAGIANAMTGAAGTATAQAAGAGATGLMGGATGAGMMAGLGAAMPYLGAGLLAGKAFGLFNQGGMVGPLASASYKAKGGEVEDQVNFKFQTPNLKLL